MIKLENGRLEMHLDNKTGSIVRIVDRGTSTIHLDAVSEGREDGRLFRLMAPVERRSSRHVDSHTSPPPQVEQNGERVILRWPRLQANGEEVGICAEVRIELPPGKDEAIFTLHVENHSGGDITDILFPWIGGWSGLGGPGKDSMVLGGHPAIDPHGYPLPSGMTYARVHQRSFFSYPTTLYCPWMDLSGPEGGLAYTSYMEEARNLGLMVENMADYGPGLRLGWGWTHFALIRPGESWESPPLGISVHKGDWHETADRYTEWTESWYQPTPTPAWARVAIGLQNVFFQGFDGTPFRELASLPEVAQSGRRYGVNHLCVWDYYMLGNASAKDDHDLLDYSEQEKAVLRRGLRQAREEGSQVSALVGFRVMSSTSRLFREGGEAEICRCYDGTPRAEQCSLSHFHPSAVSPHRGRSTPHLGTICYAADARIESYRERVRRQVQEYFDLGFTSLFHDQPFEYLPSYHPGRGDDGPDGAHAAAVSLIHEVRQIVQNNSPEGIMIGECGDIFAAQSIDAWMSWYTDMRDVQRAAYSLPQTIHHWVVDNDIAGATHAFALGLQLFLMTFGGEGTLDDVPQLAEHVARLARLRTTCAERLCWGRFRDTLGVEEIRSDEVGYQRTLNLEIVYKPYQDKYASRRELIQEAIHRVEALYAM